MQPQLEQIKESLINVVLALSHALYDDHDEQEQPEVSDDFITFCQTGKFPEPEQECNENIADNLYVHGVKQGLRKSLGDDNALNVYALIELAVEISPKPHPLDELTYPECVLYEVLDVFESDPVRIIHNLPRA